MGRYAQVDVIRDTIVTFVITIIVVKKYVETGKFMSYFVMMAIVSMEMDALLTVKSSQDLYVRL